MLVLKPYIGVSKIIIYIPLVLIMIFMDYLVTTGKPLLPQLFQPFHFDIHRIHVYLKNSTFPFIPSISPLRTSMSHFK